MKSKHFLLASLFFLLTLNSFATVSPTELDMNDKRGEIFTSKDKNFLQLWHYDQILKMDLSEKERDEYFSILNRYTYKMSRLGLSKYHYSDFERKDKFDELADKLDVEMKKSLSPKNFVIHLDSFNKIESLVYEKRNWEE